VISMNRRLAGPDASLNAPLRADSENEWQDWLEDKDAVSQETQLAEDEEKSIRMGLLEEAMTELTDRERHILTERRLKDDPTTLETWPPNMASAASGCARSRCGPSKSCRRRCAPPQAGLRRVKRARL
jgi:hypothetical protein